MAAIKDNVYVSLRTSYTPTRHRKEHYRTGPTAPMLYGGRGRGQDLGRGADCPSEAGPWGGGLLGHGDVGTGGELRSGEAPGHTFRLLGSGIGGGSGWRAETREAGPGLRLPGRRVHRGLGTETLSTPECARETGAAPGGSVGLSEVRPFPVDEGVDAAQGRGTSLLSPGGGGGWKV